MTIGRELSGHPPDAVPPQAFRAAEPICPACGYETSASFKWCPGPYACPLMGSEKTLSLRETALFQGEHLHRQCQQCSYEWLEPCLDPDVVKFE